MTIEHKDEAQVWKTGDVALAYGLIDKGFTEYVLNSRKEVVAKVELPQRDGWLPVVASYIPGTGSFQIYIQLVSDNTRTLYQSDHCIAIENCSNREELETFVRGKVEDYWYKVVTER